MYANIKLPDITVNSANLTGLWARVDYHREQWFVQFWRENDGKISDSARKQLAGSAWVQFAVAEANDKFAEVT